ncbi:MAG: hypothetical protein JKX81_05925 [Arenicella sp.]|nr:hypothetical protein [Arenicella sp.]
MLWITNGYLIIGLIFGVYFILAGCSRIDPTAASAKVLVRLMWLPAALLLWPLLLTRILQVNRREGNSEVVK